MAAQYNAPFDEQGEVREGFLCPLCLKDLQSFYQLHSHYEEEHSSEDRDVKGQLKNLVQIAKKAKNKLLKKEGGERAEGGSQDRYEAYSYGGVDPCMWDPQEIGTVRSHLSEFKRQRAARIDHYVVEVNKLIIRLEKLTSFDRINTESAKIRAIERSVVPWVSDQDVPFCPDCGNKFTIRNRRHHCRLCGSIMCKRCTELITIPFANKLTSASKHSISTHGSPNLSPNTSAQTSRRGSISSLSSVSSVLEEKDDKIRCCQHCKDTLLKREMQMDEKDHTPEIVKVYQRLRICMERVDEKAPEYIRMAQSINAGETTYNLDHANNLRMEVQKLYELIDALSKKILTLGLNEEPKPHPKNLQLQKMIRYSATLFVQEKLLGLMSLPTKEKYEELKEKRKLENEQKLQRERQAALEAQRRGDEKQKDSFVRSSDAVNGVLQQRGRIRKVEGWLPTSGVTRNRETFDPLLQQIENITSYIQQAQAAGRVDEVHMLKENLRQLQDEYDQQQVETAIRISKKLAEDEEMQREQLEVLRKCEESREQKKNLSQQNRAHSLDFGDRRQMSGWQDKHTAALDLQLPRQDVIPVQPPSPQDTRLVLPLHISPVLPSKTVSIPVSLNPFEEEDDVSEVTPSDQIQQNGNKEYNPFDEDDEENPEEQGGSTHEISQTSYNPFETSPEHDCTPQVPKNQFKEDEGACIGNPFEEPDDLGANEEELIEEDLLLQQIDNIKAYIFDAKHSGRLDEVELLTENLKELKKTLAKQKGQTK
ncbi:rabenosyn-5 [Hyla sarda]|uniref:rabenosyn-5 n=1 Tax=Hyla sarda TaxID=327740 RepID=UPI0024C30412|nr:rabenosyn-5 [Hyla sarda]XP_056380917.1 rabenosyn-5 [Hyla sarda]XP_056380918.1 rabenosyn-5 [Hyla sarda]